MTEAVELLVRGGLFGAGGAAVMDTWALFARRVFNVQGLREREPRVRSAVISSDPRDNAVAH